MSLSDDLARIALQERELRAWADESRWPVVVDVRFFGRPLFFAALAGSVPDNVEWVRRKSNNSPP